MSDDDDAVGYGRPPKAHRFRAGESGNPKGRPKGSPNFATALNRALNERVTVMDQGKPRRLTKRELAALQLVNKAVQGDLRAIGKAAELLHALGEIEPEPTAPQDHSADAALMAQIIQRVTGTDRSQGGQS